MTKQQLAKQLKERQRKAKTLEPHELAYMRTMSDDDLIDSYISPVLAAGKSRLAANNYLTPSRKRRMQMSSFGHVTVCI